MKSLSRIAVIAVAAVIILVMLPRSCSHTGTGDSRIAQIFTPKDSAFAPVVTKQYRLSSNPFRRGASPRAPVRLPSDLKESDVKEAIRIIGTVPDSGVGARCNVPPDTTIVILSLDGHVYATGGRRALSVERFEYLPPLFDFGIFKQIGVTVAGPRPPFSVSPCLCVSFIQIDGRYQFPTLLLDLDGIGAGAGYRIPLLLGEGSFTLGIAYHYPFVGANHDSSASAFKIFVTYNF